MIIIAVVTITISAPIKPSENINVGDIIYNLKNKQIGEIRVVTDNFYYGEISISTRCKNRIIRYDIISKPYLESYIFVNRLIFKPYFK